VVVLVVAVVVVVELMVLVLVLVVVLSSVFEVVPLGRLGETFKGVIFSVDVDDGEDEKMRDQR
jgi:hypothetical protein